MNNELKNLLETSFPGISLTIDYEAKMGFDWESTSKPFILTKNDKMIAHAGVLDLKAHILGENISLGCIQGVCTHPDYRKKGYGTTVLSQAIEFCKKNYPYTILYTAIPEFYLPFGFKIVPEHYFNIKTLEYTKIPKQSRELFADKVEDISLIKRFLRNKENLSQIFTLIDRGDIFLYNSLSSFPRLKLYFLPEINTIAAFEVKETTLYLYDVLANKLPSLDSLLNYIPTPIKDINFYFSPDRFVPVKNTREIPYTNTFLMSLTPLPLHNNPFMVQLLARS